MGIGVLGIVDTKTLVSSEYFPIWFNLDSTQYALDLLRFAGYDVPSEFDELLDCERVGNA